MSSSSSYVRVFGGSGDKTKRQRLQPQDQEVVKSFEALFKLLETSFPDCVIFKQNTDMLTNANWSVLDSFQVDIKKQDTWKKHVDEYKEVAIKAGWGNEFNTLGFFVMLVDDTTLFVSGYHL